jgi:hypothetical protein
MIEIGTEYVLRDVTSPGGQKLMRGGPVKVLDILLRGVVPDDAKITQYYGYTIGDKAFSTVALPFKDDRIVLERIGKPGKPVIMLGRYSQFLAGDAPPPSAPPLTTDDVEKLRTTLQVGQVWAMPAPSGQITFKVVSIRSDDPLHTFVILSYLHVGRNHDQHWLDGHPLNATDLCTAMCKAGAVRRT